MNLQTRNCSRWMACACIERMISFFVLLFALALGLVFGVIYAEQILPALAAIIVFAVTMAAAVIALLILCRCRTCEAAGD
ncbi:MAG: hypothetical protein IJO98_04905 [Clostridia bacterium]|nr:hypothetical protein [Clostridia bacterium]